MIVPGKCEAKKAAISYNLLRRLRAVGWNVGGYNRSVRGSATMSGMVVEEGRCLNNVDILADSGAIIRNLRGTFLNRATRSNKLMEGIVH
jgi:hypothetical protein